MDRDVLHIHPIYELRRGRGDDREEHGMELPDPQEITLTADAGPARMISCRNPYTCSRLKLCITGGLDTLEFTPESPDTADVADKRRDELKGRVLTLGDLVDYQDGAVASRMVVNRKAGSITIFSFDEDEGLSEHTAPYDAVVTILDGECEVWVAGKTFQMDKGETIIFPANVPHALSAITRFKMMLVMIRE